MPGNPINPKPKKKPGPKPGQFAQKHGVHVAQQISERAQNSPKKTRDKRTDLVAHKFAAEWIANGGNATQAYLAVVDQNTTPKQATVYASKLLATEIVQGEVRKIRETIAKADAFRLESFRLTRSDVLARLAMLAIAELPDAFQADPETGKLSLKNFESMPLELRSAISKISIGQGGRLNAEVYDKQAALMNYAKLQGWLTDQVQYLGADGERASPSGSTFVLQVLRDSDPGPVVEVEPVRQERDAAKELDARLAALR